MREILRIPRHYSMHKVGDCTGNLQIILKVLARHPARGKHTFPIQGCNLKSLQASVHRGIGRFGAVLPFTHIMNRWNREGSNERVKNTFIRRSPETLAVEDERLP